MLGCAFNILLAEEKMQLSNAEKIILLLLMIIDIYKIVESYIMWSEIIVWNLLIGFSVIILIYYVCTRLCIIPLMAMRQNGYRIHLHYGNRLISSWVTMR